MLEQATHLDTNEWRGVTEIINKKHQGYYRANAATAITALLFAGTFFGILLTNSIPPDWHAFLILATIVLPILWITSFVFGYFGIAMSAGSVLVTGVTENSDISPRNNDLLFRYFPWAPRFNKPGFEKGLTAYDFEVGRIEVSSGGVGGIVAVPKLDIIGSNIINAQTVELLKVNRIFGVPLGRRKIVLHFATPEDAEAFSERTR